MKVLLALMNQKNCVVPGAPEQQKGHHEMVSEPFLITSVFNSY